MKDFDEFDETEESEVEQKDENNNTVKIIIIVVIAILVLLILLGIFSSSKKKTTNTDPLSTITMQESITFELNGDEKMSVKVGEQFNDPGFEASSTQNGNLSSFVEVTGTVDTSKVGTYEINYVLIYDGTTRQKVRTVEVVQDGEEQPQQPATPPSSGGNSGGGQPVDDSTSVVNISLKGSANIVIFKGVAYQDAGARATNKHGGDISGNISTSGSVNTNNTGTYTITYSITSSTGQVKSVSRKVTVVDMSAQITPNTENYTNQDVSLRINVNADHFSHIILPNGQKVTQSSYTHTVSANGSYSFQVYNTDGLAKKYTYHVKNIDKQSPTGSCTITHGSEGSVITINARDNVGIGLYGYNDKKYKSNTLSFKGYFKQGTSIKVTFYDYANNTGTATCVAPAR